MRSFSQTASRRLPPQALMPRKALDNGLGRHSLWRQANPNCPQALPAEARGEARWHRMPAQRTRCQGHLGINAGFRKEYFPVPNNSITHSHFLHDFAVSVKKWQCAVILTVVVVYCYRYDVFSRRADRHAEAHQKRMIALHDVTRRKYILSNRIFAKVSVMWHAERRGRRWRAFGYASHGLLVCVVSCEIKEAMH